MSALDSDEAQWKEVFNIYDQDKDGKLSKADFISAVRVLGRRYSNDQMEEKIKHLGETIHYDAFYGFLCDPYTGPTKDDLINALRAFDGKDCGELNTSQIQALLTTMGDKMSMDEAKIVLDSMPAVHGKIKVDDLVEFLTPPVPSMTPNIPELLKEIMREEIQKNNEIAEGKNLSNVGDMVESGEVSQEQTPRAGATEKTEEKETPAAPPQGSKEEDAREDLL